MHSRIFQISEAPINKGEYICDSDYYDHWFTNSIADYVSDDCDRDADIEWLSECTEGLVFGEDKYGKHFIVEDREEYFRKSFEDFKRALNNIGEPTLSWFSRGMDLWYLNNAFEDKYGFYVDINGDLTTFDSFMRRYTTNGAQYYIGATIDYHF